MLRCTLCFLSSLRSLACAATPRPGLSLMGVWLWPLPARPPGAQGAFPSLGLMRSFRLLPLTCAYPLPSPLITRHGSLEAVLGGAAGPCLLRRPMSWPHTLDAELNASEKQGWCGQGRGSWPGLGLHCLHGRAPC